MGEKAAGYGCLFLCVTMFISAIYNYLSGLDREGRETILLFFLVLLALFILGSLGSTNNAPDPKNANRRKHQSRSRTPKPKASSEKRKAMQVKSVQNRPISEIQKSNEPRGYSGETGAPYRGPTVTRYTLDEYGNVVDVDPPDDGK